MGEVWLAEDTKLDRKVALKFLAPNLVTDEELRKRFQREAKAAAGLSHPNICTVHEIDEADGQPFLALEYVEGESIEAKIETGPLPISEALDIGRQIAAGLEAAHEKGIVHRDIKPANILVTKNGAVKILDFGLALLTEGSKLTKLDITVGTVAYMSPEQAQGAEVDHRTDLWALGCVLYEMVRGERPFPGVHDQALLYEIVNEDPEPLTAVRAGVPMELELLVAKCLAKEAGDRYQSASELIVDLRTLADKLKSGRSTILKTTAEPAPNLVGVQRAAPASSLGDEAVSKSKPRLPWVLLAAAMIALAAISILSFTQAPIERPVRKWSFTPEALAVNFVYRSVAVSPNGRSIAYVAGPGVPRLWVRDVDRLEPRELLGTEGADQPFWSPDSLFLGFAAEGEVKKVSIQGNPPATLCQWPNQFFGGSWTSDGESVVFAGKFPPRIFEVPAQGGEPKLLFEPEQNAKGPLNLRPHFLPSEAGARGILFELGSPTDRDIVRKNLETGELIVLATGEHPIFSPSGHVIYESRDGPWALPFSLETLMATGEAFPIVGSGKRPSVSNEGTLVSVDLGGAGLTQLIWRDRSGTRLSEIGQPQEQIRQPALSPDGRSVAVRGLERGKQDIWVHEVERPMKRRLTFHSETDTLPQWSPSGHEITFASLRGGTYDMFTKAADGTGEAKLLVGTQASERPRNWSDDGHYLVYTKTVGGNRDVWFLERGGGNEGIKPISFLATPFNEDAPHLSPDGRFLAYVSNESGDDQVYVRPFPSGDGKWQVSSDGGRQPRWSRDGNELFYVDGDTMMAVKVETAQTFAQGKTITLFSDTHLADTTSGRVSYDVSADGRFVLVDSVDSAEAEPPSIHVVENWYEEFRGREQD